MATRKKNTSFNDGALLSAGQVVTWLSALRTAEARQSTEAL